MTDRLVYGLDFGTSNSAVSILINGNVQVLPIGINGRETIPSVLFFPENGKCYYVGDSAVLKYVEGGMKGRLMQSIKSFLPDTSFKGTIVRGFGFNTLEDLISLILFDIKTKADQIIGKNIKEVILGRPALFSDDREKDEIAESRLRLAAQKAGFEIIHFQKEPIAAAFHYMELATDPGVVLVADLGGGTSDFTLVRLSPIGLGENITNLINILGVKGVYVGGNDFDSEIMWYKLVKYFGSHAKYKSLQKWLGMPVHLMRLLCTWHRIPLLKDSRTREFFREMLRTSNDTESIVRLCALVEENLGFSIFQTIEKAKCGLSTKENEEIKFHQSVINISEPIGRTEFNSMIFERVGKINSCIDGLLFETGMEVSDVDSVFLTGGSSYVPSVGNLLGDKFGIEKLKTGNRFTSVVAGLALSSRLL